MNTKAAAISIVSLFLCFLAGAQQTEEYKTFRDSSGYMSIIFRGMEAHKYNFAFNGTPYWSSPEFQTGELMYNGKLYSGIQMNVDAVRNDLLLRPGDGISPVVAQKSLVEWFTLSDRKYINAPAGSVEGLPGGYYQLVCSCRGGDFYCRVDKTRAYDVTVTTDMTGYKDPNFKSNIHDYFKFNQNCYLVRDGKAKLVNSKSALLKEFKSSSKELRKYASDRRLNVYNVSLPDYASGIFSYLNEHED